MDKSERRERVDLLRAAIIGARESIRTWEAELAKLDSPATETTTRTKPQPQTETEAETKPKRQWSAAAKKRQARAMRKRWREVSASGRRSLRRVA